MPEENEPKLVAEAKPFFKEIIDVQRFCLDACDAEEFCESISWRIWNRLRKVRDGLDEDCKVKVVVIFKLEVYAEGDK